MTDILASIVKWARREEPVRAIILEGSQATPGEADALSDYDVNMFISDPAPYALDDSWLCSIGKVWVYIPEKVTCNGRDYATRLVIFQGGVKVDFILYSVDVLSKFSRPPLPEHYDAGYKVLLDKDSVTNGMSAPTYKAFRHGKPTKDEFLLCVNEFWFEIYHVAKYLKCGELWPVKFRDWTTKSLLIRMIEWNEKGKHSWDYRTHSLGKGMKSWVSQETWKQVSSAFGRFDAEEGWQAMFATASLFGRLARETAGFLGCKYPADVEKSILSFAEKQRHLTK